jgi:predicted lactoylglutathione lyase
MTKEIWINLPVKDVEKSKAFFTELGFNLHPGHGDANSACLLLGEKNVAVMLFEENMFKGFTQNALSDAKQSSEVLISFDAESIAEVDEMAARAEKAGANIFGKPADIQGWMYGFGFADPDGHRWNMLYMDLSKMPGSF